MLSRPSKRLFTALVLIVTASSITPGCRKKARAPKPPVIGANEKGIASWYGHPYHGRRAANGEVYDMEKMTAAHRTLPFGTWVRVDNLDNGRTTTVRITDRGPFIDGRIIDLSKAAAREIAMLGPGLAKVELTIIEAPPPAELPAVEAFAAQVGSFQDRSRAERLRADMEQRFGTARIVERPGAVTMWRVLVGAEESLEAASGLAARIRESGSEAFAVRLDEAPAGSPEDR